MLLGGSVAEGAVMVSHVLLTCCDVPSRSLFVTLETQILCPHVPLFQEWLSLPHSLLGTRDSRHGEGHRVMAQSLETGPCPGLGASPLTRACAVSNPSVLAEAPTVSRPCNCGRWG